MKGGDEVSKGISFTILFLLAISGVNAIIRKPPAMAHGSLDWRYPDYIVNPLPDCPFEGVFTHPRNCTWYYRCHQIAKIKFFQRFYFQCTAGTVFSDKSDQCVFPKNTKDICQDAYNAVLPVPSKPGSTQTIKPSLPTTIAPILPVTSRPGDTPASSTSVPIKITSPYYPKKNCTLYYSQCNSYDICLQNNINGKLQLCKSAYIDCIGSGEKQELCKKNELFDYKSNQCVSKLCILTTYPVNQSLLNKEIFFPTTAVENNTEVFVKNITSTEMIFSNITNLKCFLISGNCRLYNVCVNNRNILYYLCSNSLAKCLPNGQLTQVCQENSLYNPLLKNCVTQLCPFDSSPTIINSEVISSAEISSGSTVKNVTTSVITTNISGGCYTSISNCSTFETCDINETKEKRLLCSIAMTTCTIGNNRANICPSNALYDPDRNLCVLQLCIFKTITVNYSSLSISSFQNRYCYYSYSQCGLHDTCDSKSFKSSYYFCREAYRKCTFNLQQGRICAVGNLYDPLNNQCVMSLCPISTSLVQMTLNYSDITIGEISTMATEAPSSANLSFTATTASIISSTITGHQGECFNTYTRCKLLETCDIKNNKTIRYLCIDAFRKCSFSNLSTKLCKESNYFDPSANLCVIQLCPISTYGTQFSGDTVTGNVTLLQQSSITSLQNATSTAQPESMINSTFHTFNTSDTTESSLMGTTDKCFSSYSQCREYNYCLENKSKGSKYLCVKAFTECSNKLRQPLCSEDQLYDPNEHSCVLQLCVLISKPAVSAAIAMAASTTKPETIITENNTLVNLTTSRPSSKVPSSTYVEVFSTTTIVTPPEPLPSNIIVPTTTFDKCTLYYSKCSLYEFCLENSLRGTKSFCQIAYVKCIGNDVQTDICKKNELYDQASNLCVSQLCTLLTYSNKQTFTTSVKISEIGISETVMINNVTEVHYSNSSQTPTTGNEINKCYLISGNCRLYNVCVNNKNLVYYLCSSSLAKCLPNGQIMRVCQENSLYNPLLKNCITQLCPFDSSPTIINSEVISSAEISSGSTVKNLTTSVITTNISGGCYTSISNCSTFETCDLNETKEKRLLCSIAMTTCTIGNSRANICPSNALYDPDRNICVLQLCVLKTITVNYSSLSTSSFQNRYCYYSYSQCGLHDTCDSNRLKSSHYFCMEAYRKCTFNVEQGRICAVGNLYDPLNNQCVMSLCPISTSLVQMTLNYSDITIGEISAMATEAPSSANLSFTATTASIISSTVAGIQGECFNTYTRCKLLETCDSNNIKLNRYLCIDAFRKCSTSNTSSNLCNESYYFDPNANLCVIQLCPIMTSETQVSVITATGNITHLQESSISSFVSGITSLPSSTTTVRPKTTTNSTLHTFSASVPTESSLLTEIPDECFSSYAQCREYTYCLENNTNGSKYLCVKSFNECPKKLRQPLCSDGQLYDPNEHSCVLQLCVLISKPAVSAAMAMATSTAKPETIFTETKNPLVNLTTSRPSSKVPSSTYVEIVSTTVTTPESLPSNIIVPITTFDKCTLYYSNCSIYEFCLENSLNETKKFCQIAYVKCIGNDMQTDICKKNELYDQASNLCVSQLCKLLTYSNKQTFTTSVKISEVGISETVITNNVTAVHYSNSSQTPTSGNEINKCFLISGNCRLYNVCVNNRNLVYYLCSRSLAKCLPNGQLTQVCQENSLYNPLLKNCVTQLCPYNSSPTIINSEVISSAEISSGSTVKNLTTSVITTNISGGCYTSISNCSTFETCDLNETKEKRLLCSIATTTCTIGNSRANICSSNALYDPDRNICVLQLCVLKTITVNYSSLSTSSFQNRYCYYSYSQCGLHDTCDSNRLKSSHYFCMEAYRKCTFNFEQGRICAVGNLYDPLNNRCVMSLCPISTSLVQMTLNYSDITIGEISAVATEAPSSANLSFTATTASIISSTVAGIQGECFNTYTRCKLLETCDSKNIKLNRYLCIDAFRKCSTSNTSSNLCNESYYFDPNANLCVIQLCPIMTSETQVSVITATGNVTHLQESSISSFVSVITSLPSSTTTVRPKTTTNSTLHTFSASVPTESSLLTEIPDECFSSYAQCREYTYCLENNINGSKYLCVKAFNECPKKLRQPLCSDGQLYDPNEHSCVLQLCVLISKPAVSAAIAMTTSTAKPETIFTETKNPLVNLTTSRPSSKVPSSTYVEIVSTTVTTPESLPSNIIVPITTFDKCTLYYSNCSIYEFCLENSLNETKTFCQIAYVKCIGNDMQTDICKKNELYDQASNLCVLQLCKLLTYSNKQTFTTSVKISEVGNSETVITNNVTAVHYLNSSQTPTSGNEINKCFLISGNCRLYNVCVNNRNLVYYLCSRSLAKCLPNGQLTQVCQENSLYNPLLKNCVTQLCPYDSSPTIINSEVISSAEMSSGSTVKNLTTSVITTNISGGCYTSISNCSTFETCDLNETKEKRLLCSIATTTCTIGNSRANICPSNALYDPDRNICVLQLCVLKTITVNYSSLSTSSFQNRYCYYSYSQCGLHDTCDSNRLKSSHYFCMEAYRKCTFNFEQGRICAVGNLYDPLNNQCVMSLCPISTSLVQMTLNYSDITIGEISAVATEAPSSANLSFTATTASIISSTVAGLQGECFNTYTRCKLLETCDSKNIKLNRYLCIDAFLKCSTSNTSSNLCNKSYYFDPNANLCVIQLCPIMTSETLVSVITATGIVTHLQESSISSFVSGITSLPIATTTVRPKTTTNSTLHTFSASVPTESSLLTEIPDECFSSYAQCREYTYCLENNINGSKYLCVKAFNECPKKLRQPLCSDGQLYDPNEHSCVLQLCVLISKPAVSAAIAMATSTAKPETIFTETKNPLVNLTTSRPSSKVPSSTYVEIVSTTVTTPESLPSNIIVPITTFDKCTLYYSNCSIYEFCLENSLKGTKTFCQIAYVKCIGNDMQTDICKKNELYDQASNLCVSQLCKLLTYSNKQTFTTSVKISEIGISETVITNNTAVHYSNSSQTPTSGNEINKCFLISGNCRLYNVCVNNRNLVYYLCSSSLAKCLPNGQLTPVCQENSLYNPLLKNCVTQLCPYDSSPTIINSEVISSAEISSGSTVKNLTTSVITTNISGGCYTSISNCSTFETCDLNETKEKRLLCSIATTTCTIGNSRANICPSKALYDPDRNICVLQLCVLKTITVNYSSLSTSSFQNRYCYYSYSQCGLHDTCDSNRLKSSHYFCMEAYRKCTFNVEQGRICAVGNLYDPLNNQCVMSLCPISTSLVQMTLNYSDITIGEISAMATEAPSSANLSFTATTASIISSTVAGIQGECFNTYTRCKLLETCDSNNIKLNRYLCIDAFRKCSTSNTSSNLCNESYYFYPNANLCVIQLCPIMTSETQVSVITATGNITHLQESSISSFVSGITSLPSSTTTVRPKTTTNSTFHTFSASVPTESSLLTEIPDECFSSYAQCREYTYCLENNINGSKYLCVKAFNECPKKLRQPLCSDGQLYDPNEHSCVLQLCVLISKPAVSAAIAMATSTAKPETIFTETKNPLVNLTTSRPSSKVPSSTYVEIVSTTVTTPESLPSNIIVPITTFDKCTLYYSNCSIYEFCLENSLKGTKTFCQIAYVKCIGNDMQTDICKKNELYDQASNLCVSQLCKLLTYSNKQTFTTSVKISEIGILETVITNNVTAVHYSNSSQTPTSGNEINKCFLISGNCRLYNVCVNNRNLVYYLCSSSLAKCLPNGQLTPVCQENSLYNPLLKNCVTQLCPYDSSPTIINSEVISSAEISSGSTVKNLTTSVITTNISGGCYTSISNCSTFETCDLNETKEKRLLCSIATTTCTIGNSSANICPSNALYDPDRNICVLQLCVLKTITVNYSSLSTSSFQNRYCYYSYSQCGLHDTCDSNRLKSSHYFCMEAYRKCTFNVEQGRICAVGNLYDPLNNQCVSSLCPISTSLVQVTLNYSDITIGEISAMATEAPSSANLSFTATTASIISSTVTGLQGECFNTYTRCKLLETCDSKNIKLNRYLCIDAFRKCSTSNTSSNLCNESYYFDPNANLCVIQLCPIMTSETQVSVITATGNVTHLQESSISSFVSGITSLPIATTTVRPKTTTNSTLHTFSASVPTESSLLTEIPNECFSSYAQCREYNYCLENNINGSKYLCVKAFNECPKNLRQPLCSDGQLYDPNEHSCVLQLCVLISKPAVSAAIAMATSTTKPETIFIETKNPLVILTTSTPSSKVPSSTYVEIVSTTVTTPESLPSNIIVPITTFDKCTLYYSNCSIYEFCLENSLKGTKTFCQIAYVKCIGNVMQTDICKKNELYDQASNLCVSQLCKLLTYSNKLTFTTSIKISEIGISETVMINNVTAVHYSNSSQTPTSGNEINKCYLISGNCRLYNVCVNNRNLVYYLCSNSLTKCLPNGQLTQVCQENGLYNPLLKNCVTQLCPYDSSPTIINSEVISSAEIASGSTVKNLTTSVISTNISGGCYTFISGCSTFETCDSNEINENRFLCSSATTTCTMQNSRANICPTNALYDPDRNLCVLQLCILKMITVNYSSLTTSSFQNRYCYYSYSQCRLHDTCESNRLRSSHYLCLEANIKCTFNTAQERICAIGYLYDPLNNQCVLNLCPISSSSVLVTTNDFGISLPETSVITTESSLLSNGNISTLIVPAIDDCFTSYSRCQMMETCNSKNVTTLRYMCAEASRKCSSTNTSDRLCYLGSYYDPNAVACIVQLCPVIASSVLATISIAEGGKLPQITSITTTENTTSATINGGINDIPTNVTETSIKCFTSYSQCQDYVICKESYFNSSLYLCLKAYYKCSNNNESKLLCLEGQLYNPLKHECVLQLCNYVSSPSVVGTNETVTVASSSVGFKNSTAVITDTFGGSANTTGTMESIGVTSVINDTINEIEGFGSETNNGANISSSNLSNSRNDCISSYSKCGTYEVCDATFTKINRYLCLEASITCLHDRHNSSLCPSTNLYDPITNVCIVQQCPLTHSKPLVAINSTEDSSSGSSLLFAPIAKAFESFELEHFKDCYLYFLKCQLLESCNYSNLKSTHFLCFGAVMNCYSTSNITSLCDDGNYYDPKANECVASLCPITTSSTLISFYLTTHGSTSGSSTTLGISIGMTSNVTSSTLSEITAVNELANTTNTINGSSTITFDCYSSYSQCQTYKICNSDNTELEGYFCSEAFYVCSKGVRKFKICNESSLYDPHNKNCVLKLCPLMVVAAENNEDLSNASDDENETNLQNNTISEFAIENPESINYTEVVFCQLKYDFCKSVYNYNQINSFINAKYLCQCKETCYFRNEVLNNLFLCYPPLFEVQIGSCSYSGEKENCMIGTATSSLLDEGNSFSRFKESLKSAISSQSSYQSRFRSKLADLSRSSYANICSEAFQKPKAYWIQKKFCSDVASCIDGEKLQLWQVKSLCTHFIECQPEDGELRIKISSCPKNQFYSYTDDQCVDNEFRTDSCALYMGDEPFASILRLFAERLPFRAKTFLNTRLIGL